VPVCMLPKTGGIFRVLPTESPFLIASSEPQIHRLSELDVLGGSFPRGLRSVLVAFPPPR
jgi:hypothetical protein